MNKKMDKKNDKNARRKVGSMEEEDTVEPSSMCLSWFADHHQFTDEDESDAV